MPPASPLTLTLIVAATPSLGIGRAGTLPWKALKGDMAFFARVTKRAPPTPSAAPSTHHSNPQSAALGSGRKNVVVMGRKTWDSIPPKFRPLKDRTNVVVTRDENWSSGLEEKEQNDEVLRASSLTHALELLRARHDSPKVTEQPGRVFIIGGSSIYAAAKELKETKCVLLTRVEKEFECDTFFPIELEKEEGWVKRDKKALGEWVQEDVGNGRVKEGDVEFEFEMWERE